MGKLWMIAGRQVQAGESEPRLGAYVVLSAGQKSRIFSVRGTTAAPLVKELPAATTIDMKRFESELEKELLVGAPAASATRPAEAWVCGVIRAHLKKSEDLDVE
jgi:hypothetical protein